MGDMKLDIILQLSFSVLVSTVFQSFAQYMCGAWWLIGRFDAFRPKGRRFESRSSRHVGTLDKSFTRNCLWRFDVKLRHSSHAVSGTPLISSGFEEAL